MCFMCMCATHRACLDFQVPFDPTWQQEQLSLGAPPSLHTNNQSEGAVALALRVQLILRAGKQLLNKL